MNNDEFYRHLRRVRRIYGERRKVLLEKLSQEFALYGTFFDHQAGMQIVFNLNQKWVDADVAIEASRQGIAAQPLSQFSSTLSADNGLVLGYCGFNKDELSGALVELKAILDGG